MMSHYKIKIKTEVKIFGMTFDNLEEKLRHYETYTYIYFCHYLVK